MIDLTRACDGGRGLGQLIAVEDQTYDLVTALERIEPDVRGNGILELTPQQAEQLDRPLSEQQRDLFQQVVDLVRHVEMEEPL